MHEGTTVIGLDVHKRSIAVAIREPGIESVREERLPHERSAVTRWAKRWKRQSGGKLVCACEAGVCGLRCSVSWRRWGSPARWWLPEPGPAPAGRAAKDSSKGRIRGRPRQVG